MSWTEDIHLSVREARDLLLDACDELRVPVPFTIFDAGCDEEAYVFWPEGNQTRLMFRGRGCTLDTLAHELAHLVEGPDEPTHGADHNFLTRLLVHYLLEKLNVAGS